MSDVILSRDVVFKEKTVIENVLVLDRKVLKENKHNKEDIF